MGMFVFGQKTWLLINEVFFFFQFSYISNPDELEALERDANSSKFSSGNGSASSGGGGSGGSSGGVNSLLSNSATAALSSLTSSAKSTSFFSRKSKRKDEAKNSKNSRLQSPLKDGLIAAVTGSGSNNSANQSNSLFYLNANDLNNTVAASSPTPQTSPFSSNSSTSNNSHPHLNAAAADDAMDTLPAGGLGTVCTPSSSSPSSLALLLKDKQRLEERIRELGLDFFNEDFEGITVSTTKCLSCETITEQKETMIDIAVPVPQAGYDSNDYMDRPSSFIQVRLFIHYMFSI